MQADLHRLGPSKTGTPDRNLLNHMAPDIEPSIRNARVRGSNPLCGSIMQGLVAHEIQCSIMRTLEPDRAMLANAPPLLRSQ